MEKMPFVNIRDCNMCLSCVEVCPEVFRENCFGSIEVVEKKSYSEAGVNEAIKYCPQNCIKMV